MKKITLLLSFLFILNSCQNDDFSKELESSNLVSKEEINKKIFSTIKDKGDFQWSYFTDDEIWQAFQYSNQMVSIAWDFNSNSTLDKQNIINFIILSEGNSKDIFIEEDDELKVMLVKIKKKETFFGLRKMQEVQVLEPAYEMYSTEEADLASKELNFIKDKTKPYVSKNKANMSLQKNNSSAFSYYESFDNQNITSAWDYLSGQGITAAVIDGGVLENDLIFGINGNINGNNPNPRSVQKKGFYKFYWWNPFSNYDGSYVNGFQLPEEHGTQMSTTLAGPIGAETGVAYNSNLISIRSSWGVWIDPLENNLAVARAYKHLAYNNNVKVISMSQGSILNWIWVTRAIELCYAKGKLMFAAGGTFYAPGLQQWITTNTGFTLFPARLNEVYSCTGIKKLSATNNQYNWCNNCFGVSDFVLEFNEDSTTGNVGSSSMATATTAGIATLIWSNDSSLTRDEVIAKMIAASDYPTFQHPYFGHGRVNMDTYLTNEGFN